MMNTPETNESVAAYLFGRRGQITRRWLRAVHRKMGIRPRSHEAVAGLVNQLPVLFDELCAMLRSDLPRDAAAGRARQDAREHAVERWRQGFALDELYLELDLLHRCVQACVREYFAGAASRESQTCTHEVVEEFFGDTIRTAIRQFQSQADRRAGDAFAERDEALAAQRRTEEHLRIATEAAGLGIFEWNPQTDEAVWENARMFEITGQPVERGPLTPREFAGILASADEARRLSTALGDAAADRDINTTFEIRRVLTGEHRFVEVAARLLPDASGVRRLMVGTMADITRRVRADQRLREADRRKDLFLATLAHELRNPLAPVLNAAHLLRRPELPASQLQWAQGMIERHTTHLARLIDDLLDLSRISAGKINLRNEVFDLGTAIERAIEINAPAATTHGHRIEARGIAGDAPVYVRGDPTRITQVVANLLDNAIKYSGNGGHIHLSVERTHAEIQIAVQDNGVGMDPAQIPSMFEMFEQAGDGGASAKRGLGIGLSVARSLVGMHGGSIQATSEGLGRGSRFVVTLPACDALPDVVTDTSGSTGAPAASLRILVVDDNYDAAMSLAALLEVHDVRTAGGGDEALEMAEHFAPAVIILDLGLPDISGFDVAKQLRAAASRGGRAAPVLIALTGYGQPEDLERTRQAGFDYHIVKPARPHELIDLLHRLASATAEP